MLKTGYHRKALKYNRQDTDNCTSAIKKSVDYNKSRILQTGDQGSVIKQVGDHRQGLEYKKDDTINKTLESDSSEM
jgi:hypothetical protein